jgi:drug/metabolite transporter (DMT)-like permease
VEFVAETNVITSFPLAIFETGLTVSKTASQLKVGIGFAFMSALAFGLSTPLVAKASLGLGVFSTASLLYLGAGFSAFFLGKIAPSAGIPLGKIHVLRVFLLAFIGGAVAPTLLAFGLQRVGGLTGSLFLNLEAVFTAFFAFLFFKEPIGKRVGLALFLMCTAGILLSIASSGEAMWSVLGSMAVIGATAAWALDNTLSRPLSQVNPVSVVAAKGFIGAALTGTLSFALEESIPNSKSIPILLICGATGYGLSLRLYLMAQRKIGAARTASVFALAPFFGAALGFMLTESFPSWLVFGTAVLFLCGVYLHATENHEHHHKHQRESHAHTHRHDDGHHLHSHNPALQGEHTHEHVHEEVEHEHDHAPDVHHEHSH